nr:hypothetical protein [Tanacetum cinerariifolium]
VANSVALFPRAPFTLLASYSLLPHFIIKRLWDELYRLETSMMMCFVLGGAAAYMERKEDMWPILGPINVLRLETSMMMCFVLGGAAAYMEQKLEWVKMKEKENMHRYVNHHMEALVSHLVAASMVKSPENVRFSMKLRKLITEHPDQEKLKSKKVKLEALGYKVD